MNYLYALPALYQKGKEPQYVMATNAVMRGPYISGFCYAPNQLATKPKRAAETVLVIVMQKKYSEITFPYWSGGAVFWIIVMAGPEYVADTSTFKE